MTASILQEQLAPIVGTLRGHARLLDLHAAHLDHNTAMNRYNFTNCCASNYNFTLILRRDDGILTTEIPKHLQPAQALKHS